MKKSISIVTTVFIVIVAGCVFITTNVMGEADPGKKLFTAYNVWFEKPERIYSINYKKGAIIPAGTKVRDVEIITQRNRKAIIFTTVKENKSFVIYWVKKYHPGKSIKQFKNNLFTTKRFEELTAKMNKEEIMAVKKGEVVKGMSKRALIVCYGPPPEHATFRREQNVWTYWTSKFIRKKVFFSDDGRVSGYKTGM